MAAHVYHDSLTGFDERQILHDGCPECEARGADPSRAIGSLDESRFELAWMRAANWQQGRHEWVGHIARAEAPLLSALWAVQVQLERRGVIIGSIPGFGGALTGAAVNE